jgi:hypothetical protein
MDTFIEDNNINKIEYLSIDTQGNDLKVLNGFGNKIKIVEQGVCESLSEDTNFKLYENQPAFSEFVEFFKRNGYSITWDWNYGGAIQYNEVNITFKKINLI